MRYLVPAVILALLLYGAVRWWRERNRVAAGAAPATTPGVGSPATTAPGEGPGWGDTGGGDYGGNSPDLGGGGPQPTAAAAPGPRAGIVQNARGLALNLFGTRSPRPVTLIGER